MSSTPTTYRAPGQTFGRGAELDQIDRWCDLAFSDTARAGLVLGQPGVGKSALLDAVAARQRRVGVRVLSASCSSYGGVPYLPLTAALAPLMEHLDQQHRPDLSPDDLDALQRLDHLGAATTDQAPAAAVDPPLHRALTRLVLGAVRARPTILVLDDLHEVDAATAAALEHLLSAARHDSSVTVPLLVLAAARPGAGERHARRSIDRLRGAEGSAELVLGPLDELGLNDLLRSLGLGAPTPRLLHVLHEQSSGNPLLARLLWAHLHDRGAVRRDGEQVRLVDPTAPLVARVDLADIVDARLDSLSAECRDLLGVASVLGVRGDLDELGAVADLSADAVDRLLAEAESIDAIVTSTTEYWFDHPLLAAACARHRSPRRRQADHLRAAREADRRHGDQAAIRVAAHLRAAGGLAEPEERRRVGTVAARQAMGLGAWGAAADALDLTLAEEVVRGWSPAELLELHCLAAEVAIAHQDAAACEHHAMVAIDLARSLGDAAQWGRAVVCVLRGRVRIASVGSQVEEDVAGPFLEAAATSVPATTAVVHGLLSELCFTALDFPGGLLHAVRAREDARRSGEPRVEAFGWFVEGLQRQGAFELDESDECLHHGVELPDGPDDVARWCRARMATTRCMRGELRDAEASVCAAVGEAGREHDWSELALMQAWSAAVAAARGRWAEAEDRAAHALQLYRRTDYEFAAVVAHPPLVVARAVRGDLVGALDALDDWASRSGSRLAAQLELQAVTLGGTPEALAELLDRRPWRPPRPGPVSLRNASSWALQVELAVAVDRPELGAAAIEPMCELHRRGVRFVPGSVALVARLAAVAHAAAGELDAARAWFHVARDEAERCGARAEAARTTLDLARFRSLHGDHDERGTVDHLLTRAAAAFNELGMLVLLRRTEQHLGASSAGGTSRSVRTILFTDVVESTRLNVALGNEDFVALLRAHDRIARRLLREHDGVQFKHTGDGLAAWFASPGRAVEAALAMQEDLEGLLHAESGRRVRIRCGLAAGEPIEDEGDLFGISVVRAARVCAVADAGEVLVAGEIPGMARRAGLDFEDLGALELKGLPGATPVFRARRAARPTDPRTDRRIERRKERRERPQDGGSGTRAVL